jgi:hypothetical protein
MYGIVDSQDFSLESLDSFLEASVQTESLSRFTDMLITGLISRSHAINCLYNDTVSAD